MYTEQDIDKLKRLVIETINPEKVILFGSYAYGIPNDKSDIDLLVVMPNEELSVKELVDLGTRVNFKQIKMKHEYVANDLCVVAKADIRELYNDKNSCIYDAMRKGKLLYDQDN